MGFVQITFLVHSKSTVLQSITSAIGLLSLDQATKDMWHDSEGSIWPSVKLRKPREDPRLAFQKDYTRALGDGNHPQKVPDCFLINCLILFYESPPCNSAQVTQRNHELDGFCEQYRAHWLKDKAIVRSFAVCLPCNGQVDAHRNRNISATDQQGKCEGWQWGQPSKGTSAKAQKHQANLTNHRV